MKYAILYESKTGNTEILARAIYDVLDTNSKICMKISDDMEIPDADMYFVGFPIRKKSCSMRVIDCLEEIEYGKVVLFATCGMKPTDKYRDKLEDSLSVWLPDEIEYKGLFLSQGTTSESQKEIFYIENPEYIEYLTDNVSYKQLYGELNRSSSTYQDVGKEFQKAAEGMHQYCMGFCMLNFSCTFCRC